jgi:hypothetical protein
MCNCEDVIGKVLLLLRRPSCIKESFRGFYSRWQTGRHAHIRWKRENRGDPEEVDLAGTELVGHWMLMNQLDAGWGVFGSVRKRHIILETKWLYEFL